jgi:cytoskeletal protein CcmA (bactofilin family)
MSASASPPTPTVPAAPTPLPRSGDIRDAGAVRRDSVHAQHWSASGAAKVLGDVDVDEATLSGIVSIRGNVTGGSVSAAGTCDIGGSVRLTAAFRAAGTTTVSKGVQAAEIDLSGSGSISGPVQATGTVRWKGSLETTEGITAGRVEFEGSGTIPGSIVAKEVEVRLRGASRIGSILADRVRITRPGRLFGHGEMFVLTIEAKDVELEGVEAQHVKAERVALGPGCQIAQVDGTIIRQHASAHVGPASHSPPPYGLMR